MEGVSVKLIIKAPNQQIKDQIVKCDIGWSVARLKEHLAEVYPSKPEVASQKLIHAGQLLNDSSRLKEVLRQCEGLIDQDYTIHLVCTPQKMCANKITSEKTQYNDNDNASQTIRTNMELARSSNLQNQNQNQEDNSNAVTSPSLTQLYSMQQYFDPRYSQQIAWMQQAYTHYIMQYMQLMAAQGIRLQSTVPYPQQINANSNETIQNSYVNVNNNNVGDEQLQPAAQEGVDVNGGNNVAGEDGAFNWDWLDLCYVLSRIIILFSIVYFYSSPLRFFFVTFLGFTIYLYQGGFFRVQPVLVPENNNVHADNNNQVLQNEVVGRQAVPQQQNGQTPVTQPEARTNANGENEEERPGALAFTWTFFSSFFASLIPDQPNVI